MISSASLSGTILTINGSGFGTKANPKPLVVADFATGLNPSTLGQLTTWDNNLSMAWNSSEGVGGKGCAKSTNDSGVWGLSVDSVVPLNPYNGKFFSFMKRKRNFSLGIDGQPSYVNWKESRIFTLYDQATRPTYSKINHYWSPSNGSIGLEWFTDIGEKPYSYYPHNRFGITKEQTQGSDTDWYISEERWQANSAASLTDGKFWISTDNVEVGKLPDVPYSGATYEFQIRNEDSNLNDLRLFYFQGIEGSESMFAGTQNAVWFDYLYMDNSWARVMIGDNLDYSKCTKDSIYYIPTSTWSDGNIVANTMGHPGGFVHVCDELTGLVVASARINGAVPMTTTAFPLASYPTGIHPFGPIATPNGLAGMNAKIARCTTADPTIWPSTSSKIRFSLDASYDGGNTYQVGQFAWEQGGGIIVQRGGVEAAFSNVSFSSVPNPTHIKGSVQITNGPIKTSMTLVTP